MYPSITCDNTEENSFTIKKNIHRPSGFSMLTSYAYDKSLNKPICYHGKDCLAKFSEALKDEVNKIISIKQKSMNPLTDQEKESYANAKTCFICEKPFGDAKNGIKVRDHCHYTG